jgi:hypothetical protein
MKVPRETKRELSYDPAVPLLRIYTKDCKSAYNRDTCTHMFIAALFTTVKLWNHTGDYQLRNG